MELTSTKEKILDSAYGLFSIHGYHSTLTTDIAKKAGVSQGLIFHYFGNKEQVWHEVRTKIANTDKHHFQDIYTPGQSFEQFLENLIGKGISFYHNHPDIIRIKTWDSLEFSKSNISSTIFASELAAWKSAFEYYQEIGQVNPKLNSEFMVNFVTSLIYSSPLNKGSQNSEQDFETYCQFCCDAVKKAFKVDP